MSSVSLGGIVLEDDLVITGLEEAPPIAYQAKRTMGVGGRMVVDTWQIDGGRTLVLSGENHFSFGQIKEICALARLGQPVPLIHHRGVYQVIIVKVDPEPGFVYANPKDDTWYSAEITMIEV